MYLWVNNNTVKPVYKGNPWKRQNMVFTDKWPLFKGKK